MNRRTVLMVSAVLAFSWLLSAGPVLGQVSQKPVLYWSWLFRMPLLYAEPKIAVVLNFTDEQVKQIDALYQKIVNTESTKLRADGAPGDWKAYNSACLQMKEQCKDVLKPEQWALVDKLNAAATTEYQTLHDQYKSKVEGAKDEAEKKSIGSERYAKQKAAVSAKVAELLTDEQKALLAKTKVK